MHFTLKMILFSGSLLFGTGILAQEVDDRPKSLAETDAERQDRAANWQLETALQKRGTSDVNKELVYRLSRQSQLEGALIARLNSPSVTRDGQASRSLSARMLGELHSHQSVPALVDNLLFQSASVVASGDSFLGNVRLTYPCTRALIEIGLSAEPLIVHRIAKNNRLSNDHIEMAAYCLLMIHNDSNNIIPHVDEADRAMLVSRVERAGSQPDANKEGLNALRNAIATINVAEFKPAERVTER